ncbi:MAG: histone deacetylase family protein [Cocleimonas sp.]
MKPTIITHKDCLTHGTITDHKEIPERLSAVIDIFDQAEIINAPFVEKEDLLRAHTQQHIDRILQPMSEGETLALDYDTNLDSNTADAALRSAGASTYALDQLLAEKFEAPFCAVRPPGHHAEPEQAMGFCYFSNVAITALRAKYVHKVKRVAVVDFDVHHGNGTQACLTNEEGMYFGSIHQHPHYPNTGKVVEHKTACIIRNVPLEGGISAKHWREAFNQKIIADLHAFKPRLIIVSAGFDAYKNDPYGDFNLETQDYAWLGTELGSLAKTYSSGHIVSIMEGGYDLVNLANSAKAYQSALMESLI